MFLIFLWFYTFLAITLKCRCLHSEKTVESFSESITHFCWSVLVHWNQCKIQFDTTRFHIWRHEICNSSVKKERAKDRGELIFLEALKQKFLKLEQITSSIHLCFLYEKSTSSIFSGTRSGLKKKKKKRKVLFPGKLAIFQQFGVF